MGLTVLSLNGKLTVKIRKYNLKKKWEKQIKLFRTNLFHPSLNFELLEPKQMGIYSFRIDRKFRALLFFRDKNTVEILNITAHYR